MVHCSYLASVCGFVGKKNLVRETGFFFCIFSAITFLLFIHVFTS